MSLVTISLWYRRVEFSCVGETSKLRGKNGKPSLVSCSRMGGGDTLCTAVEIHCSCLSSRNHLSFSCTEHGCSWQPLEICVFKLFLRFWPKDASEVATHQWLNTVGFQNLFLPHLNVLQQELILGWARLCQTWAMVEALPTQSCPVSSHFYLSQVFTVTPLINLLHSYFVLATAPGRIQW